MSVLRGLLVLVLFFFTVMLSFLLGFHTFLASKNVTTWEFISWNRIGYLKDLEKKKGSPFSQGLKMNLYMYFCEPPSQEFKVWSINNAL